MERFIKTTSNFIFSKQKSIFSSAMLLSFMIVLTSLSGFLRYRVLAGYFNKEQLDIFFASFRIPDLIFEILITGALTTTFIPIFLCYKNNKTELSENISSIINFILLIMSAFVILTSFFLDRLIPVLTPGYSIEKTEKIIYFSRLLLLGQLPFFVAANFLTGIGQANKMFFLSALAPVLYNLTIIVTTVFFHTSINLSAPIWGVIFGSLILFLIQFPLLMSSGFVYKLLLKKTKGLIDFIRLVIPRTFTIIVAQIDATIDLTLATLLGGGAYTVFYLAQHLQLLPVSVIGIALGQASLPYLTEIYQEKKLDEFKKIITDSLLNLFFLTVPLALFFIFARTPLIRFFFGGQKFDWEATVLTAVTLSYFSIGLPFHSVYYLLTRCFYALMDSRTPFFIGFFSILINTGLSLFFVFYLHLPIWALAISFSISMIVNSTLLFLFLWKRISGFNFYFISMELVKINISAGISAVISYLSMKLLDGLIFDTSFTINVFLLLATTFTIFILLYLLISWLLDVKEIYLISRLALKAKEYQKKITELYTRYE
jgi:putative peptidoglycan lipid II flippase